MFEGAPAVLNEMLCATLPSIVQVTVPPLVMVTLAGENEYVA
jgi:hypothetical protein